MGIGSPSARANPMSEAGKVPVSGGLSRKNLGSVVNHASGISASRVAASHIRIVSGASLLPPTVCDHGGAPPRTPRRKGPSGVFTRRVTAKLTYPTYCGMHTLTVN
jgi:hypothetical protein